MWFRDAYVVEKLLKFISTKNRILVTSGREGGRDDKEGGAQEGLPIGSQFSSSCPGRWRHQDSLGIIFNCPWVVPYSWHYSKSIISQFKD